MHERRFAPRYRWRQPLHVQGEGGARFAAESRDVSLAGVAVVVTTEAALALAQGGSVLTLGDRLEVILPAVDGGPVAVPGRVRHVNRQSQGEYQVGLVLAPRDPAEEAALAALVEQARARGL